MVGEEGYEEDWQEEEDWNDSYDGYWADDQDWNDGYWATEELHYKDEYGYFQKKGKGKKGKKGKDDEGKGGKPGDGKGKSNYVQPQSSSTPAIQNAQPQQAHYSTAASSSGHGFFAFAETDPARVDVLDASYEEQSTRRTRRGGQNKRDALAERWKEKNKYNPVRVGQIGVLDQKSELLFWKEKLMHFNVDFNDKHHCNLAYKEKAHHFSQLDTLIRQRNQNALTRQRYQVNPKLETLIRKRNQLSLNALIRQRNQLRNMVSFHFIPSKLMHVRMDFLFTQRILHLQLYVSLILVAQELWDLERQLMHSADMLTHIPTVVFGMKFNRPVQGSSLQTLSNQSAQRRLSDTCMTMDGTHNSQSSTLSKKVMSHC